MTFYEKYPRLQEQEFLTQVLTETVYTTMCLEDQQVPRKKVREIVADILDKKASERDQFRSNQTS